MKDKTIFLLVFLAAVTVRLYLNFSIQLIPGIGGGYYPVQIREILQEGQLAMSDMPLVFYFLAAIVKTIAFILPGQDEKDIILCVTKAIDAIVPPLLLIPLYKTGRLFKNQYSILYILAVAGFAVLSFSPLEMASDGIKNNIALVFMATVILYYLKYLKNNNRSDLLLGIVFLIITGLTHFGTFAVTMFIILAGLIVFYKRSALIPMAGVLVAGALIIAIFDMDRAMHLFTFWTSAFTVFISPRLIYYPYGIFNYLSSFLLIWIIIRLIRKRSGLIDVYERQLLILFMIVILVLSFPFLNFEFGRRFGLMLFVPQSVLLLLLYPHLRSHVQTIIASIIIFVVLFTVATKVINPRPLAVSDESYSDMLNLKHSINHPESSIVFVRHGLEWWVAWELDVHIAGAYIEVDEAMKKKYDNIYFLVQKKGENHLYPGKTSIFKKPEPPEGANLVYNSDYFDLYVL